MKPILISTIIALALMNSGHAMQQPEQKSIEETLKYGSFSKKLELVQFYMKDEKSKDNALAFKILVMAESEYTNWYKAGTIMDHAKELKGNFSIHLMCEKFTKYYKKLSDDKECQDAKKRINDIKLFIESHKKNPVKQKEGLIYISKEGMTVISSGGDTTNK